MPRVKKRMIRFSVLAVLPVSLESCAVTSRRDKRFVNAPDNCKWVSAFAKATADRRFVKTRPKAAPFDIRRAVPFVLSPVYPLLSAGRLRRPDPPYIVQLL